VIVMASQNITRQSVLPAPAAARPYQTTERFRFLGMYGETDDVTGGFGEAGVRAHRAVPGGGGTLITTHSRCASRSSSGSRAASTSRRRRA
jgi:hypothetical protein